MTEAPDFLKAEIDKAWEELEQQSFQKALDRVTNLCSKGILCKDLYHIASKCLQAGGQTLSAIEALCMELDAFPDNQRALESLEESLTKYQELPHHQMEFTVLSKLLPSNAAIFDIGSNVGNFSAYFLKAGHRVLAVEPVSRSLKLQKRRARSHLNNGSLLQGNFACGKESSKAEICLSKDTCRSYSTFSQTYAERYSQFFTPLEKDEVSVLKTSTIFEKFYKVMGLPDLLKIDCPGSETQVLEGLVDSENQALRPHIIMVELIADSLLERNMTDVLKMLESQQYRRFKGIITWGAVHIAQTEWKEDPCDLLPFANVFRANALTPSQVPCINIIALQNGISTGDT